MLGMAELHERREEWQPPPLPEGIPENFRLLLTTRPPPPAAPTDFEPWPFRTWRTEVLRRAEFITEGTDAGPTFGNDPAMQAAARPGFVPGAASAWMGRASFAQAIILPEIAYTGQDREHQGTRQ